MRFIVYDIRPGHQPGIHLPVKSRSDLDFAYRHYYYDINQQEVRILVGAIDVRSYRAVSFLDTSEGIERIYRLIQRYLGTGSNFVGNSPTDPKDPDNIPCYAIVELKNKHRDDPGQRFLVSITDDGLFVSGEDVAVVAFDTSDVPDGVKVLMKQFGHTPAEINNVYQNIHVRGMPGRDENLFVPLVGDVK